MIQWSGQSKMGQTPSRARSRRRVGEADHHARPRVEAMVVPSPVSVRGVTSAPIIVEDEEEDVVVSSPRSFAQAIFKARVEAHRSARPSRVTLDDDPLELRLGPGGISNYSVQPQASLTHTGYRGRPSTIDLTTPTRSDPVNEDCVLLHEYTKNTKKRKPAPVEPFFVKERSLTPPVPEAEDEYKFKCAICMDTMKDETSTICGHIFCQTCIQGAINSQKKCPTCRKKLTLKNIHRIYL